MPPVSLKPEDSPSFQGLRIAWTPTFPGVPAADDIRKVIERFATELAQRGSQVEVCLPDVDFAQQSDLFHELLDQETTVFQPQLEGAKPLSLAHTMGALDLRDAFILAWERFFDDWDVMLCPVAISGQGGRNDFSGGYSVSGSNI